LQIALKLFMESHFAICSLLLASLPVYKPNNHSGKNARNNVSLLIIFFAAKIIFQPDFQTAPQKHAKNRNEKTLIN